MITIKNFVFSPFQENTYVLSDESGECIIIDPGCLFDHEKQTLSQYIADSGLKPVKVVNTHLHLDHVFGSKYIVESLNLDFYGHENDEFLLAETRNYATQFGVNMDEDPAKLTHYLNHGDTVSFGNSELEVRHAPGHSPGSVVLYSKEDKFVVVGDVLFRDSIGRTDLPQGNHAQLLDSIREQLFTLGDDVVVYSGHGPTTTIGYEKDQNRFLQ